MIITNKILTDIKNMLTREREFCGNFKIDKNDIMHYSQSPVLGPKIIYDPVKNKKLRGSCTTDTITPYYWHTHPNISKYYPSIEDIMKTTKKRNMTMKYSIIFTKWGIWTLSSNSFDSQAYTKYKEYYKKKISIINNFFYNHTVNGMEYNTTSITQYCDSINYIYRNLKYKCTFTKWNNSYCCFDIYSHSFMNLTPPKKQSSTNKRKSPANPRKEQQSKKQSSTNKRKSPNNPSKEQQSKKKIIGYRDAF